ncbi:MAG: cytochrome P450, partial [Firmicutes bacterium]|nr:cytochrome P450 [Bacillota bacterium]
MSMMFPPELQLNPYPMYARMRSEDPVSHNAGLNLWSVFRYDDVRTVLSDHAHFSSQFGGQPRDPDGQRGNLITSDPPRHTQLRSLVNRAFTPRAVQALAPRIEAIAQELLCAVVARDAAEIDLVKDFSYPLPVIVIAEMLGIPASDREQFKHWSDEIVESADQIVGGGTSSSGAAHEQMAQYFHEVIGHRRAHPSDDLISGLIAAEVENEHLSESDILALCWLLLVAGNETTTNLITNAVRSLLEHPDQLALLRANDGLWPLAIEEALRYRSPVQAMFRVTKGDTTIGDVVIPAGSRVVAWIGAANRDPARFPDADAFDVRR